MLLRQLAQVLHLFLTDGLEFEKEATDLGLKGKSIERCQLRAKHLEKTTQALFDLKKKKNQAPTLNPEDVERLIILKLYHKKYDQKLNYIFPGGWKSITNKMNEGRKPEDRYVVGTLKNVFYAWKIKKILYE